MRNAIKVSLAALGMAGGAGQASAAAYVFTTFDVPGSIPGNTLAGGINNAGQVTGVYADSATNAGRSFVDTGGTFSTFIAPSGQNTSAFGINDAGQVVGAVFDQGSNPSGFISAAGSFSALNVPFGSRTTPQGINDAGQIVGSYVTSIVQPGFPYQEITLGFEDTGGAFSTIDVPNSTRTVAEGINGNGLVVGYFTGSNSTLGFVDAGGSFSTIGVPGAYITEANGVNNAGTVVGFTQDSSGPHGFVQTSAGDLAILDVPGATYTQAIGINDAGVISGYYYDGQQASGGPAIHGFIATPVAAAVPEPASAGMLGLGLAIFGAAAWRRGAAV